MTLNETQTTPNADMVSINVTKSLWYPDLWPRHIILIAHTTELIVFCMHAYRQNMHR